MPPYALHLLIALALVGVTRLVAYPLNVGSGVVDALDAVLMMLALVNLRLAWTGANASGGGRPPAWFVIAGLAAAGLITLAMVAALTPRPA